MPELRCPFLKCVDDPDSYYEQADDANACYRHGSPQPLIQEYQDRYCLTDEFNQCPVYQYVAVNERNQLYLEAVDRNSSPKSFTLLMFISLGASAFVLICLLLFSAVGGPARVLARTNSPSMTPFGSDNGQGRDAENLAAGRIAGEGLFSSVLFEFTTQTPTLTSTPTIFTPSDTPLIPTETPAATTELPTSTDLIVFTTPTPTPTATVYYLPTLPRPSRTPTRRATSTTGAPPNPPTSPPPTQAPPTSPPPTQPPPPTSPPVIQPTNPPAATDPPRPRPTLTEIVP